MVKLETPSKSPSSGTPMNRRLLRSLVGPMPSREVRHLVLEIDDSSRWTTLYQVVSGVRSRIASGAEYDMLEKAEMLSRDCIRSEGFRALREGELVFEALPHTVGLATALGLTTVRYAMDEGPSEREPSSSIPLAEWAGLTPSQEGSYEYALVEQTKILARPALPPGCDRVENSKNLEDWIEAANNAATALKAIGPTRTFALG